MKKIIDGKRDNTETATKIAEASSDCGGSDFRFFDEALYQTKKGAFFLSGTGGAMSRWSQRSGDGRRSGSGIDPMTPERALQWAERHMTAEAIEATFGDMIADA